MERCRIRMSTKGQLVMPRAIRERHGWGEGTALEVVDTPRGVMVRDAPRPKLAPIDELVGCIPYRGKARTVAEMERALRKEAIRRGR